MVPNRSKPLRDGSPKTVPRCLIGALAFLFFACAAPQQNPPTPHAAAGDAPVALVEHWDQIRIENAVEAPSPQPLGLLTFDDASAREVRWSAVQGIEDLRVENGRLVGRTVSETPILSLKTEAMGVGDALQTVSFALSASAGTRAAVHPPLPGANAARTVDLWPLSSALFPGDEIRNYVVDLEDVFLLFEFPAPHSISEILVRPTNQAGAEFAIESVQLIFRRERLRSIPSGPGLHGLGEVFREALVSRGNEALRFDATLPSRPWLDLAVGSLHDEPPLFRVNVLTDDRVETAVELRPEAPDRWRPVRVDLSAWAKQNVVLELVADSEGESAKDVPAFWGHPTIRQSLDPLDAERPQTVVVFVADTLRPDRLDAWGHERETAPTLTRLATEGARFADTAAQSTWTKASLPSLLTSLYPSTLDIADVNDQVAAGETLLAEAFRDAGYATFSTSSIPFSGRLTSLHQGVEVMHEFGSIPGGGPEFRSKTSEHWVDVYLDWLETHHDVPTFALIHAMDPHKPFRPPTPHDTRWTSEEENRRFEESAAEVRKVIENPIQRQLLEPTREQIETMGVDPEAFVEHEFAWYDGSIRHMDDQLARVVSALEDHGIAERSLLAFVSDHGEELLEHDAHSHGRTVYGEVVHVPLVLWGQGVPRNLVVEETVSNLDVYPTLLDLAGLPIPERVQGRSLLPRLRGETLRPTPAFVELLPVALFSDRDPRYAILDEGWKLIRTDRPGGPEYELYRHETDPFNLKDVAAEHPQRILDMAKTLEAWRTGAVAQRLDESGDSYRLSAEERKRLRSLGYLD